MNRIQDFLENENKKFCIDVDDIIINTTEYWMYLLNNDIEFIEVLKENDKYPIKVEDIKTWDYMGHLLGDNVYKYHLNGTIYDEYTLMPYAKEFINSLVNKIGLDRILFVTASNGKNEDIKESILEKEFNIPSEKIIHTSDKYKYYKNNIFIDDAFHNFKDLIDCVETIPIILNSPWNEKYKETKLNRIYSLKEICDLLA